MRPLHGCSKEGCHDPDLLGFCLDCSHPLLASSDSCGECGRKYDALKPRTYFEHQPLNAVESFWARPLSWSFVPLIATGAWLLLEGTRPEFYYLVWIIVTPAFVLAFSSYLLIRSMRLGRTWELWRKKYPFAWVREVVFLLAIILFAISLVFAWPLKTAFYFAKAALDERVSAMNGSLNLVLRDDFRAGIYVVSSDLTNSWNQRGRDGYFTFILADEPESGFVYSENGIDHLLYNPGNKGRLFGNWYWMTED